MHIEQGAHGLYYAHDELELPGSLLVHASAEGARDKYEQALAALIFGEMDRCHIEGHQLVSYVRSNKDAYLPIQERMSEGDLADLKPLLYLAALAVEPIQRMHRA
jgi:hypothetical protein